MSFRLLAVFLALAALACNNSGKPVASTPAKSTHSPAFDSAVGKGLEQYYDLVEKFVNWDSVAINASATQLNQQLQAIPKKDLNDTSGQHLSKTIALLDSMESAPNLADKRIQLNALTENYFSFLRSSGYNASEVYMNACPMAFHDEDTGVWLSKVDSIRNPYLGLHHPVYGKAMLECGSREFKLGVN